MNRQPNKWLQLSRPRTISASAVGAQLSHKPLGGPSSVTEVATAFEQLRRCHRINVIGTSGSGKTTLARELAQILHLPYYEMDQLFWKSGWRPTSDEKFAGKVREIARQPKWVLDGNYTRTTLEKWNQVQAVVWLDLSFVRTVLRVTRRAIQRSIKCEDIWPGTGNRESLAKSFLSRKSVILWAITTYPANRRRYTRLVGLPEYSHIDFSRLTSPASASSCLATLRREARQTSV